MVDYFRCKLKQIKWNRNQFIRASWKKEIYVIPVTWRFLFRFLFLKQSYFTTFSAVWDCFNCTAICSMYSGDFFNSCYFPLISINKKNALTCLSHCSTRTLAVFLNYKILTAVNLVEINYSRLNIKSFFFFKFYNGVLKDPYSTCRES